MIIGIHGKIGHGKDTVAGNIIHMSKPDHNWQVKRYADKLKDIVCLLIGCTREQLEDRVFKETPLPAQWQDGPIKGLTPRIMLQLIGTEGGRNLIHPNIWVNSLMSGYVMNDGNLFIKNKAVVGRSERYTVPEDNRIPKLFWGTLTDKLISTFKGEPAFPNWLITDVRFPNEAQAIRDKGGVLIKVVRPGVETPPELRDHPSETGLDNWTDWDYEIENDGSLAYLETKVSHICYELKLL